MEPTPYIAQFYPEDRLQQYVQSQLDPRETYDLKVGGIEKQDAWVMFQGINSESLIQYLYPLNPENIPIRRTVIAHLFPAGYGVFPEVVKMIGEGVSVEEQFEHFKELKSIESEHAHAEKHMYHLTSVQCRRIISHKHRAYEGLHLLGKNYNAVYHFARRIRT